MHAEHSTPDAVRAADAASPPRRWRKWGLRLALAVAIGYLAYRYIDFVELRAAFATVSATGLVLLLLLATADRWLMAAKWFQLARPLAHRPGLTRFAALYYSASFIDICLPAMIGGDLYRAVGLGRDCPTERDTVYASAVMEKVVALVATLLFAWVGLALLLRFDSGPTEQAAFSVVGVGSLAAAVLIACSFVRRLHDLGVRVLGALRLKKLARFTDEILGAYRTYSRRGRLLLGNLGLALIENAWQIAIWWLAARELGVSVPTSNLLAIIAVSQFARRAVNYVQGGPVADVLNISLYALIGVDASQGLALTVLVHGVSLVASMPGAVMLLRGSRARPVGDYAHAVKP